MTSRMKPPIAPTSCLIPSSGLAGADEPAPSGVEVSRGSVCAGVPGDVATAGAGWVAGAGWLGAGAWLGDADTGASAAGGETVAGATKLESARGPTSVRRDENVVACARSMPSLSFVLSGRSDHGHAPA